MSCIRHNCATALFIAWCFLPVATLAQRVEPTDTQVPNWYLSLQYLGVTYHPNGGNTPEIYPLKLDEKAYIVFNIGLAANLDYRLNNWSFLRFSSTLYKDCAFVTAGGVHLGPRFQLSWSDNSVNIGIGPIFSFRRDWHQFGEYKDDEFYGSRVYHGWQYRFFPTAVEFEYLRKISESMEFQWSVIPGGELIITSLLGIRFAL